MGMKGDFQSSWVGDESVLAIQGWRESMFSAQVGIGAGKSSLKQGRSCAEEEITTEVVLYKCQNMAT